MYNWGCQTYMTTGSPSSTCIMGNMSTVGFYKDLYGRLRSIAKLEFDWNIKAETSIPCFCVCFLATVAIPARSSSFIASYASPFPGSFISRPPPPKKGAGAVRWKSLGTRLIKSNGRHVSHDAPRAWATCDMTSISCSLSDIRIFCAPVTVYPVFGQTRQLSHHKQ